MKAAAEVKNTDEEQNSLKTKKTVIDATLLNEVEKEKTNL